MRMSAQELEDEMVRILASASQLLPTESFDEAQEFITHNEFPLALDTIAAILAASDKRVGPELYAKFLLLANELQMDPGDWELIRPE